MRASKPLSQALCILETTVYDRCFDVLISSAVFSMSCGSEIVPYDSPTRNSIRWKYLFSPLNNGSDLISGAYSFRKDSVLSKSKARYSLSLPAGRIGLPLLSLSNISADAWIAASVASYSQRIRENCPSACSITSVALE